MKRLALLLLAVAIVNVGAAASMPREQYFNLLSLEVILLPFIDWTAVVVLARAVRRKPHLGALKDRLALALVIAGISSLLALLGLSRLGHIPLPNDLAGLLIVGFAMALSMVNLGLLARYWGVAWK